jgi:hypothetical protein
MAVLAGFALIAGSSANARGPVKFDTITFTGATYHKVTSPTADDPTGNTGLKAGLQALTGDARTPISVIQNGGNGVHVLEYAPATDRLKVVVAATGAEVADNVDLSGTTFHVQVISV